MATTDHHGPKSKQPVITPEMVTQLAPYVDLLNAITDNNLELIHSLVDRGVDVNTRRWHNDKTAIHVAASSTTEVAEYVLNLSSDVDVVDSYNCTPLFLAALVNHVRLVTLLLERGARTNIVLTSNREKYHWSGIPARAGWTALHAAASRGNLAVVRLLVEHDKRSPPENLVEMNEYPLDLAMLGRHIGVVRYLLQGGHEAAPESTREFMRIAADLYDDELVELLARRSVTDPFLLDFKTVFPESRELVSWLDSEINTLNQLSEETAEQYCPRCMVFQIHVPAMIPFDVMSEYHSPEPFKLHGDCRELSNLQSSGGKLCRGICSLVSPRKDSAIHITFAPLSAPINDPAHLGLKFWGPGLVKTIQLQLVSEEVHAIMNLRNKLHNDTTDSPGARLMSLFWFQSCLSQHRLCNMSLRSAKLPKRVLDVGDKSSLKQHIYESDGEFGLYATLSHRWGNSHSLLKTTASNLASMKHDILTSTLSQTLKDAISITRSLGLKYLWVDCLCIIQDSEVDWITESQKMANIYRYSAITIAASESTDHTGGIYRPRIETSFGVGLEQLSLPFRFRAIFPGDGCFYTFPWSEPYLDPVRPRSKLDSRGWVLQEQLLSPRLLYFSDGELHWECYCLSASETYPMGYPSFAKSTMTESAHNIQLLRRTLADSNVDNIDHIRLHDAWSHVAENYSRRQLTNPSDRIMAITGVTTRLESILDDQHIFGMWKSRFWAELCWWMDIHGQEKPVSAQAIKSTMLPSWAWTGSPSPVSFRCPQKHSTSHRCPKPTDLMPMVEILSFGSPQPGGELHGKLVLRGEMCRRDRHEPSGPPPKLPTLADLRKQPERTRELWPEPPDVRLYDSGEVPKDYWYLFIARGAFGDPNWKSEDGRLVERRISLILSPVLGSDRVFRRIGLCYHHKYVVGGKVEVQNITII